MAKTADCRAANRPSPKDGGRTLRQVRKQQGLSRTVVARSSGLTRRELSAYERGRVEDLWCLAGSCGVEIGVGDTSQLYGRHVVRVTLRSDQLTAQVDDEPVLEIASLSRASIEARREPCRGDRIGIQAWSTTEVTVESFRVATL